ncbi:uncharacterized protein LOC134521667 isoform X1 [Chroicocephalus ridibundus]|uniref:uncharacterized protein LOC134521667 isoform X1 n=1 Tax=Chroicocephalus ridibundus TaxID=1192867 RepID=UPI002FDD11A6
MLPIFTFQAALCALVILEACRDVTTVDVRVCDYVIFDLDYAQLERSFWISWHKGNKSTQRWTYDNTRHGQNIRVFPNGTLGLRVVGKEDAGWYTATVCNSSQHCLYQSKFQLRVHGHLVRGHVGDCVTFDLNCVQSVRYIHIMWKKENQRVAKIRQAENAPVIYCNRAHVFPNGSLSRCPTQWGDEGEYVAEVYDEDGFHLHQETFNLELHRVETFKEITEFIGGSMFLNLTETKLKHFFQVVWKKENREIAWTNGSWVWYHEEYCNRSEIVSNYSLRLDRIQKRDCGRYSIEANDRNGRTVYECIANVKVEQKETFGRNPLHVPFYILIVSLGVVTITVLVALIWHFQKHKDRSVWITVPSIRRASLILTDDRDNPEEDKEREENSPCSQNGENLSVQGLDGTNFTEQKTNDLLRNNKEANPATADKVMYSVVSRFQDGERPKLPGLKSMKSVKPQASVNEAYVAPNIEKTTRPESEHCNPHRFEDCFSPDFDHSIPPVLDGCTPAEFSWCSPPGLEDLKDDYLPSGSTASCKCSEGDMSSQYAVVKSTRGLPEDKPGDSVCSSSH